MPSTYSPNLRIELIATGEQANTWGSTTNTNLGTLLEQAISGIADINVTSGDVTLTTSNGASDQARCMVLNITGTPGTTRNIITPASVTKAYIVNNASNASVIVKTAAAGANATVTIQAGGKQTIYTDGTNVYNAASATSTEISYLTGVTSNIQAQLNASAGAGSVNGILKSNGASTFSAAVAGTDYVIPSGSITGNAGTVTDGVYTTGNQTIGGIKTFSSTIVGSINGSAATATTATTLSTASGSAPVYGARAYGSYSTTPSYAGSTGFYYHKYSSTIAAANVSIAAIDSIGKTRITFSTPMPSAAYVVVSSASGANYLQISNKTTSSFDVFLSGGNVNGVFDFAVFG